MSDPSKKTVAVRAELYEKLAELAKKSGAASVDELVSRVLRDWVSLEGAPKGPKPTGAMTPEDEKVVEERLKSLGYT